MQKNNLDELLWSVSIRRGNTTHPLQCHQMPVGKRFYKVVSGVRASAPELIGQVVIRTTCLIKSVNQIMLFIAP